jgi:signal transduction histidine kinase
VRRLYAQIFATVAATLLVFALLAGVAWRLTFEPMRHDDRFRGAGEVAAALLPPAEAPAERHQAALDVLHQKLRVDLALYAADGRRLAAAGARPPEFDPALDRARPRFGAWALPLGDGRWLVARLTPGGGDGRGPGPWVFGILVAGAGATALCAFPLVRRLTRRLERLKSGVERLGGGDLAARVKVEGRDEIAALAGSFNATAARIESLVRAHKMLLANCSHELRTPLARIKVGLELAASGLDAGRRAELARDIAELDALIDEILVASRLDSGGAPDRREPVDLLALAAEEAARDGLEAEGTPATVLGDPALLRRLIRNLVENARRHGGGAREIRVGPAGAGRVELIVADSGPGIPAADRLRLFEPFYRPDAGALRGGSGLGLAIVRQIAERHGGSVACESPESGGARFRVVLPGA